MSERGRFRGARERAGMVPPPTVDPDPHIRGHLAGPLFQWCLQGDISVARSGLSGVSGFSKLRELSDRGTRMCVALGIAASSEVDLIRKVNSQPDILIDMVDWLVREHVLATLEPYGLQPSRLQEVRAWLAYLVDMLESGGSAWTVDLDRPGLTQRVSAAERDDFDRATAVDDPAAEYLREAWAAAWGVSPDGELAYDKAIKALEAMFRPVVIPKNPGASLGEIARDLRAKPGKWRARMEDARDASDTRRRTDAGVSLIESVAGTIFAGNHRHAGAGAHAANSLDEGRDAVTLAVALIAIQRRGFVTRL